MRTYNRDEACPFRFTRQIWGEFSNFQPLAVPIAAGPWTFPTSEHAYQAAKFGDAPDVQHRIANAPTAREAAAIGRSPIPGMDPHWTTQRVNVMRWVLRMKREANAAAIDAVLAETGQRAIVEVSTRDAWWGAHPAGDTYRGNNVLGRLWMELREHHRTQDPLARSGAWLAGLRIGALADPAGYELVGRYADFPETGEEQIFSTHSDETSAWTSFHEALRHTDARVVQLRATNPGKTVLASSEHPPYSAIYHATTLAQVWS